MAGNPKKIRGSAELDDVDLRLIALLQENARTPNNVLAEALGIAPSTCLARVRGLRTAGVIRRFTADVDPAALGRPLQALVAVRLRPGARHLMGSFGRELQEVPEVEQVFVLGGADDFLLHITASDTDHIRQIVLDHLSSNPAVAGTQTSLIFEHSVGNSAGYHRSAAQ